MLWAYPDRIQIPAKDVDDGKSVLNHFDLSKATRPGLEQKRVTWIFQYGWFSVWTRKLSDWEYTGNHLSKYGLLKNWKIWQVTNGYKFTSVRIDVDFFDWSVCKERVSRRAAEITEKDHVF